MQSSCRLGKCKINWIIATKGCTFDQCSITPRYLKDTMPLPPVMPAEQPEPLKPFELTYMEVDEAERYTGRSITLANIEFQALQYADLIDHKLGSPISIPLQMENARVVESTVEGVQPEMAASAQAFLQSTYSSRGIGLVRGGWLPAGMALQDGVTVMPDRCTLSEIAGRFRDGEKTRAHDRDFLDLFAGHAIRINPLLYALEGNLKRNPTPENIEQQFDVACEIVRAALPLAQLVPPGREGLRGVTGLAKDSELGMARKQEFLMRLAPKLRALVAFRDIPNLWDEILETADACGVPRRSLVVLAALSTVCVPNGKSPAKRLLKVTASEYTAEHAYNALADLRSLEILIHLFARYPDEKVFLCTNDKDLALFWAGIRASNFTVIQGQLAVTFCPVDELLVNAPSDRRATYLSE
ncbi:hypothetical protein ALQ17_04470 [Pseudomonas fluorescens]|nr:hypothetical protein ALQ17_04470 [Pseudomonas fluorescens]